MKLSTYLNRTAYTQQQAQLLIEQQSYKYQLSTKLILVSGLRAIELMTVKKVHNQYFVTGKNNIERRINVPLSIAQELEYVRLDKPKIITFKGKELQSHFNLPGGVVLDHTVIALSKSLFGESMNCGALRHLYALNRWNHWYKHCNDRSLAFKLIQCELGDNYQRTNDSIKQYKNATISDYEQGFVADISTCSFNAAITNNDKMCACFSANNLTKSAQQFGITLKLESVLNDTSLSMAQLKEAQWAYDFAYYQCQLVINNIYSKRNDVITAQNDFTFAKSNLKDALTRAFK